MTSPMLLSFRFANHRSFRDEQQLNLMPIYDSEEHAQPDWPAVSVAGIFGANASGKSNFIDAFSYMRLLVGRSDRLVEPGYGMERRSFKLDPDVANLPSSYAIDLRLDGIRYTYGFTIYNNGIAEEWLHSYPKNRSRTIFERQRDDFSWGEDSRRAQLTRLAEIVAPTALFLSVVARFGKFESPSNADRSEFGLQPLHSVYSWVWQRQVIERPSFSDPQAARRLYQIASRWSSDDRARAIVVDLLRGADIGLIDVSVTPPQQLSLFPEPIAGDDISRAITLARREGEPQLRFKHRGASKDVFFEIADESSGTIGLLQSAVRAVPILESGGVVLIDEIDASLHPLLTANLIALFQSKRTNRRGAQLIFTSHDATLLGLLNGEEVLRRDQVWFTHKNGDGASRLFPLSDFRPRKEGENRMRRYLSGTYGAIPELSMHLFEEALRTRSDNSA
ncbi:MAG TPA: ATP-binding protein [Streptosporangiaceae bacterium]|nr:ATP-binding protein [Streptosporangiaceae bacterium]